MSGEIIEDTRSIDRVATIILAIGLIFILGPLLITVITATQSYDAFVRDGFSLIPGGHLLENMRALFETRIPSQIINSLVVALMVAVLKCTFAFLAAFGLVFFRVRYAAAIFALIMSTIMLPLDLRIVTTYQVVSNLGMPVNGLLDFSGLNTLISGIFGAPAYLKINLLDSYAGIVLPALATGTGVFMMRQFFRTLPGDLLKAALMDGAGWFRFMIDIALPLARTNLISLFILMFLGGWTMYLWPLLASSTPEMQTAVVGLARLSPDAGGDVPNYPVIMAGAILVSILPLLMIAFLQRYIVRGMTLTEK